MVLWLIFECLFIFGVGSVIRCVRYWLLFSFSVLSMLLFYSECRLVLWLLNCIWKLLLFLLCL